MNRDRWQQIDELFQGAVELEPERRAAWLDEACAGDQALRDEVESMLASDAGDWDLIERPALESAALFVADFSPQLVTGQRIAHYEIVSLIGQGGMGEVYLAKDETLKRRLALKLLPVDYIRDQDRLRRFQQEAHAASALNHPNILTIYELGQADDRQFIATEFVDGETLRQRMKHGELGLGEALDIAIQTAGALAAAHQAGIVHRDIKPENIMLRPDGFVKVLDFGLAKLVEQHDPPLDAGDVDGLDISSGLLLGTVKYMSPEQARGMPVDPRSDIFSLGVVLYEMVAGRAPFHGDTAGELIEAILKEEPPSLSGQQSVPDKLGSIVGKALGKRREARYQTAKDLVADLQDLKEELHLESRRQTSGAGSTLGDAALTPDKSFRSGGNVDQFPALTGKLWRSSTSAITGSFAVMVAHKKIAALFLVGLVIGALSLAYLQINRRDPSPGAWVTRAPMLRPRGGAATAALDGKLYVATGDYGTEATNAFEVYDPLTDQWSTKAPIPTARDYAGAAGIAGRVYVFGGCGRNLDGNQDCRTSTTNILEAYDPTTNTWTQKTPMPTARSHLAAAVMDGKLYVAGGRGPCPPCPFYNNLEVYDPVSDTWDITRAPMPTALVGAGAAAINGRFYVAGGAYAPGNGHLGGTLAAYDPATDKWTLRASMPTPREGLSVETVHGILYAISGEYAVNPQRPLTLASVVEAYDPGSDKWMSKAPIPNPRVYQQAATINGVIYMPGGRGAGNLTIGTLEAYTAVCPDSTCLSAPADLVGWWPGDGEATDIVRSNKSTLHENVTFKAGKIDQAFNFDGASFLTVGNSTAINLIGNQVTIDGWINPNANVPSIYFGKTKYALDDYLLLCGDGLHGLIRSNGIETAVYGYSDFPASTIRFVPPTGQWTHIALTYDGTMIKLYANGALVGQESKTGNIEGDDVPFVIGGREIDNGTGKFNGLIDEVQIFNRALSEAEIQSIFAAGGAGQCKPRANCL